MVYLSKNFTLKELTRSNTALRLGIDNEPSKEGILKLTLLATSLLQPLRNVVGSLRITSGYRSPQLSEAIGSSSNSQHCRYEAVDMQYVKRGKMDNIKIYDALIDLDLDFDQCILEFGNATEHIDPTEPDWIHLSWKVVDNRRQTLVAYKDENNKTKYRPIINYNCI
jgi:zinc D-Ala-D-Ala carboxypeptidase